MFSSATSNLSHNKHVMETHLPGQLPAKQLCSNLLHEDATALCDQDQAHHTQDHETAMTQTPPAAAAAAPPPPPRRVCLDWTEAAKSGDTLELRRLLRAHPSILDHKVGGLEATATHWAAANGHADALQHLLEWGADVLAQTATGCLPLHSAAAAGREACVQLLLAARPDLQQHQLAALNEDGLTPAALAMHHSHRLVHGLLLAAHAGSGSEQQQEEAKPAPQQQQQQQAGMRRGFLLGGGQQSSSTLQKQESPTVLPQGTDADDASLLGAGSPAQQQPTAPQHNSSPAAGSSSTDVECPAPGQHACADFKAVPAEEDAQQQGVAEQPPAAQAAAGAMQQQQPAAFDRALGRRWLDAARAGDLRVLQALLLQAPQLLDYRGAGISYAFVGNSALHWAAAKGHTAAVAWLLRQGAAVAAANEAGASALHTAVEHGQPGCAEALVLLGGAEIQAADGYGQSVLSLAGTDGGSRGRGCCAVRAEQLLLWDEARKLQQQQGGCNPNWGNVAMQRFLQLAGKAGEAARCLEKQELVALAAAELQRLVDRVAAL